MATYLPNSYSETPITSSNISLYMNSGSYPEAFSGNSQEQNDFGIPPMSLSQSAPEQQEILANLGGLQSGDYDFTAWRQGRNEMLVTHQMDGHNLQSQGLSLSLGTHTPSGIQVSPFHDQSSNPSFDSFLGQNQSMTGHKSSSSRHECMRHGEILTPDLPEASQVLNRGDYSLHGMPSVSRTIPNSKYLKAAQELLDEVVDIQKAMKRSPSTREKKTSKENNGILENERAPANGEPNPQDLASNTSCEISHAEKQELQNKLTKLLTMLDEVHNRYKQYFHQMQNVVSSFDVIAGRGAAKPYTALALQTISRHFRCLHDAITGQISATQKCLGEQDSAGNNNKGVGISRLRYVDQQIRQQRALQQLGVMHHAWRPQRGLPEGSVSILRAWLFEHFLHPYPKDSEKAMLARQTGLSRSQVSNWFINARVRLWKPMIEEMYKEEIDSVDLHSSSSTDDGASKVSKSDVKVSDDGCDDFQQSQSSIADKNNHNVGQTKDLRYDNKQTDEQQRLSFDDCNNAFPDDTVVHTNEGNPGFVTVPSACQMSELGRYQAGTGVSLTLGLQHCEVGDFMPGESRHHSFVVMREDGIYNAAAIGAQTSELDYVAAGNHQHQRFTSPH